MFRCWCRRERELRNGMSHIRRESLRHVYQGGAPTRWVTHLSRPENHFVTSKIFPCGQCDVADAMGHNYLTQSCGGV